MKYRIKAFYPVTTPEILHKGKDGNTYRLDGIEKLVQLRESFTKNSSIDVIKINSKENEVVAADLINNIHSTNLLKSYKTGSPEALANSSGTMWQPKLYDFVIEQAIVSQLAAQEANNNGTSIAISGGGHHVEKESAFGFGQINTIAISALEAVELGNRVAVLDLDTHYSNGCIDVLRNREGIKVYSLWNQKLDKWKFYKEGGNIWHKKVENVEDYFLKLNELMEDIRAFKPDLIIYHLGLDILDTDRMGGVKGMNKSELLKKEALIKTLIRNELNTKLIIFLGGAYIDWSRGKDHAKTQMKDKTETLEFIVNNLIK